MAPNCPTCGQPIPAQDDPVARFRVGMRVRWSFQQGRERERFGTVVRLNREDVVINWDDEGGTGIYDAPWFRLGRALIVPVE